MLFFLRYDSSSVAAGSRSEAPLDELFQSVAADRRQGAKRRSIAFRRDAQRVDRVGLGRQVRFRGHDDARPLQEYFVVAPHLVAQHRVVLHGVSVRRLRVHQDRKRARALDVPEEIEPQPLAAVSAFDEPRERRQARRGDNSTVRGYRGSAPTS